MKTAIPCHFFSVPRATSLRRLAELLERRSALTAAGWQRSHWQLYDSADGCLHRAGRALVWEVEEPAGQLCLRDLHVGTVLAAAPLPAPPPAVAGLPEGALRTELQKLLGARALVLRGAVRVRRLQLEARDDEDKTVARLFVGEYRPTGLWGCPPPRVVKQLAVAPLRGYQKSARQLERRLKAEFACVPAASVLAQLLGTGVAADQPLARPPPRPKPVVDADMPAAVGVRRILGWLLAAMEANAGGVAAGADDPEFLHDYRVAVRTTQAVVRQLRPVFGGSLPATALADFAWLGGLGGASRDLDVALLALADYRAALPAGTSAGLEPLRLYLLVRRAQQRAELVAALASARYRRLKAQWRRFLRPRPTTSAAVSADALGAVVGQRSARLYQRILREGRAVVGNAEGAALHELRKSCKKLNYLLTLFREMHGADTEPLLRKLKRLQRRLGEHQDCEVQTALIEQFRSGPRPYPLAAAEASAVAELLRWYGRRKAALRADVPRRLRALRRHRTGHAF